jgi:hypothetical protein
MNGQERLQLSRCYMFTICTATLDELNHANLESSTHSTERQTQSSGCFTFSITRVNLHQSVLHHHLSPTSEVLL